MLPDSLRDSFGMRNSMNIGLTIICPTFYNLTQMRYKEIISASNPVIKEALKVKGRKEGGRNEFLVEGPHLLEMALTSGAGIRRVFLTHAFRSKNEGLLRQLSRKGSEVIETEEHILSRLSDTETPQGVAALVSYKEYSFDSLSLKDNPMMVVCDGIQDPGNLGTIIRTSDAAGADAVILLPGTCDFLSSKVVRASAGSIFSVPVLSAGLEAMIQWLKKKSIKLVIADARATRNVYEADLRAPLAFALGNEARGVSKSVREKGDLLLRIPIMGSAESLNVGVSAAVLLYEAVRQRTMPS